MRANIASIAKATLLRLNEKKLHPTPANYAEVFEECAKKAGFASEERTRIDNFISKLDEIYRHELKHKYVRSTDELISFLIARVNAQPAKKHKEIVELFRFIIDALLISRDKKIKDLAAISLPKIVENMDLENIFLIKAKWREFKSSYDSEPLFKELESEGIKANDFYHIINDFLNTLEKRAYSKQAKLLLASLRPSFGQNNSLDNFCKELELHPWIISERDFEQRYFKMLEKKKLAENIFVEKNLSFFQSNLSSIEELLSQLFKENDDSKSLVSMYEKDENGNINISFELLRSHFDTLNEHLGQIKAKLDATQDSTARDDWTLLKEISKLDENFNAYKVNYALCIFKIKNTEELMDKYGVNSFNAMSLKLKNSLRENCDKNDELWIVDESSFLVILPGSSEDHAIIFQEKILSALDDYRFVYKEEVAKLELFTKALGKGENPEENILELLLDS